MRGDPCSSVYCGSICEDICSSAEEIRGAIGVTTSDCWSVGVVLVSLFSRYFFGFRFDGVTIAGQSVSCVFHCHLQRSIFLWIGLYLSG